MKKFFTALVIGSICCTSCSVLSSQNASNNQLASKAHALSQSFENADSALTEYRKSKSPSSSKHFSESLGKIAQSLDELKPTVSSDPHKQRILYNLEVLVQMSLSVLTELRAEADEADQKEFQATHMSRSPHALTERVNQELAGLTQ